MCVDLDSLTIPSLQCRIRMIISFLVKYFNRNWQNDVRVVCGIRECQLMTSRLGDGVDWSCQAEYVMKASSMKLKSCRFSLLLSNENV